MVGVGGRSKACHNCRRRRVACDQTRPTCNRCTKARLKCEGYDRATVFIYENPKTRYKERTPEGVAPAGLLSGEEVAHLSHLMDTLFVTDERSPLAGWAFEPWSIVAADPASSASLAARALAAAFFGHRHGHRPACVRGAALYGAALKQLRRELSDPDASTTTHILASLNLSLYELAILESQTAWVKHAQGIQQMIVHGRLKPHHYQEAPARMVFRRARSMIVVQAIIDRRRTFLEEEDWLTVPWAMDAVAAGPGPGSQKSALDQLCDIMCFIPGILQDKDTAMAALISSSSTSSSTSSSLSPSPLSSAHPSHSSSSTSFLPDESASLQQATQEEHQLHALTMLVELRERLAILFHRLYAFRQAWEAANPYVCSEVPSTAGSSPLFFFPAPLHFTSLTRANEVTLYNAVLIILLHLAEDLGLDPPTATTGLFYDNTLNTFGPLPPSTNPLRPPGQPQDTPRAAAHEICRCAAFHLADPPSTAGPFFLLFPLSVARREFVTPGEPEGVWIDSVLRQIATRSVFVKADEITASGDSSSSWTGNI